MRRKVNSCMLFVIPPCYTLHLVKKLQDVAMRVSLGVSHRRNKLLSRLVVWKWVLLYLLPDGSRAFLSWALQGEVKGPYVRILVYPNWVFIANSSYMQQQLTFSFSFCGCTLLLICLEHEFNRLPIPIYICYWTATGKVRYTVLMKLQNSPLTAASWWYCISVMAWTSNLHINTNVCRNLHGNLSHNLMKCKKFFIL